MKIERIGVSGYLGLAVIVALNLALFRGVMQLLAFPAISMILLMVDMAMAKILIWRSPLRPFERGFIAFGFLATILSLPFNNDPRILGSIIGLYREATGDMRVFRFNNTEGFLYAERAVLGTLILGVAVLGGLLSGWMARRRAVVRLAK
jgi:hypothetical protein